MSWMVQLGAVEFRRVMMLSVIFGIIGMIQITLASTDAVGFLQGFFLIPLLIAPFVGSFGKVMAIIFCAVMGTLWGANTLVLLGMNVNGAVLAISLAVGALINTFAIGGYTRHRRNSTVLNALSESFTEMAAPVYGGYLICMITFLITFNLGQSWALGLVIILLHQVVSTTFTLPASVNLYEHYMEKRAITQFEKKVLSMIKEFGAESNSIPMIASWLGAGVEEVIRGIENLRAKHYITSGKFFYPSNSLMWFVGVLAPVIGYSVGGMMVPTVFQVLAMVLSSAFLIFGLSLQRSWWLNFRDRFITHFMGFTLIMLGVFFGLAISVNFSLLMLLTASLGVIVCYLPEERISLATFSTATFYVLEFLSGWAASFILGAVAWVYGGVLFATILADLYLVREERYVRL